MPTRASAAADELAAERLPTFAPIERTGGRASDRVFDELVTAIRDLRLAPGRSLSETELSQHLQVSRTPLRAAMARLVDNGLVHVIPQVGSRVCLINLREVDEAQFIREHLEVAAFERDCRLPERDIVSLRRILDLQRDACDHADVDAFFAADDALHGQFFAISGYPLAWRLVQRSKLQLDRVRRLSFPDVATLRESLAEHTILVDALERRDVRGGRRHIRMHAGNAVALVPSLLERYPDYFTEEGVLTEPNSALRKAIAKAEHHHTSG